MTSSTAAFPEFALTVTYSRHNCCTGTCRGGRNGSRNRSGMWVYLSVGKGICKVHKRRRHLYTHIHGYLSTLHTHTDTYRPLSDSALTVFICREGSSTAPCESQKQTDQRGWFSASQGRSQTKRPSPEKVSKRKTRSPERHEERSLSLKHLLSRSLSLLLPVVFYGRRGSCQRCTDRNASGIVLQSVPT